MDLAAQLRHLDLAGQLGDECAQPLHRVGLLQQRNPLVEVEVRTGAGDVGDQSGLVGPRHGHGGIRSHGGAGADILGEQVLDAP